MLLDPFTVSAQIVNFLILVWLLKRFLYRPILAAMDARERRVAAAMEEADARAAAAKRERAAHEGMLRELTERREQMLADARQAADEARQQLLHEAREQVARAEARWRASVEHSGDAFRRELSKRVQAEVLSIARSTLSDLAGPGAEERMADLFLARWSALDSSETERLAEEARRAAGEVTIRSAFDLPPAARSALETAVKERLQWGGAVRFDTSPDGIGGIELAVGGLRVSWTIAAHLDSLEKILQETLSGAAEPDRRG